MSFSSDLKSELGQITDKPRHCRISELAGIISLVGNVKKNRDGEYILEVSVESPVTADTAVTLLRKLFDISVELKEKRSSRNLVSYCFSLKGHEAAEAADALKVFVTGDGIYPDIARLTDKSCCKRAFLRGVFIACGSISDPDRHYHLEIPCREEYTAVQTERLIRELHLEPKTIRRQKHFVVYIKDSNQISDLLGLMGARKGLLELENARIRREVKGNINRRVNCETANINKTAAAAARQIELIKLISQHIDINMLPKGLDEMARVRLSYPEASLSELGQYLEPPVGKSGVNHRLRKLEEIASALKSRGGD